MYLGGIMRTKITLIVGLSPVFLFLSIYGTPYVNGQSSTLNSSSVDNDTSSTNSELKTENLDPFVLKGSSNTANTGNSNDPAQADDGSSTNSNNDDDESSANSNSDYDGSSANSNSDSDGSSANSNSDSDGSSANSNSDADGSSANSKNDDSDKDGSDDDKSSKDDKESKDDKIRVTIPISYYSIQQHISLGKIELNY